MISGSYLNTFPLKVPSFLLFRLFEMWAQVKFQLDQQVILTPVSNFKDHHIIEEELKSSKTRPIYEVFWSPNSEDTPQKVLKKEGRILQMDSVKQNLAMKRSKPQAGWYKATIKQWESKCTFFAITYILFRVR